MDIEELNLGQICRTCKCVAPEMRSLFEGSEHPNLNHRIDEMLMACASVQVVCGDGLPSQICQKCADQLLNAFIFKCQCERIDASLREYVKNVKDNEIKHEPQDFEFIESLSTLNNLPNEQSFSKENIQERTQTVITPKIETDYIQFMDNNQTLLTCHKCTKTFTTPEGLQCHKCIHSEQRGKEHTKPNNLCHEQSHNRRKMYVCRICSKTMTTMKHLKRHLVTHLKKRPFSCTTCQKGFNRIEHLRRHTPSCKGHTVFPCYTCRKAFDREDSLEVHKKTHDNQQPKLPTIENLDNIEDHYYQIDQDANATLSDYSDVDDCSEPSMGVTEYINEEIIKEEAKFTYHDEESNVSNGASIDRSDHDRKGDIVYRCGICDTVFDQEDILDMHKKMHDSQQPKLTKIENLNNIEDHYQIDQDVNTTFPDPFGVDDCFELKVEAMEIVDEEEIKVVPKFAHHNEEISVIEGASIGYENHDKSECKAEDSNADNGVDESLEDKNLGEEEEVKEEKALVNFGFEFDIVGGNNEVVNEDSSDSTDSEYISKKSTSPIVKGDQGKPREDLNSPPKLKVLGRRRGRPPKTDKKERKVEEYEELPCQVMCTTMADLDRHARLKHQGIKVHKCKECNKEFSSASHLKRHVTSHSLAKPFRCTVCTKSFNRRDHLSQHQKLHGRPNEYQCDICQKPFDRSDLLAKHKIKHTNREKISSQKKRCR